VKSYTKHPLAVKVSAVAPQPRFATMHGSRARRRTLSAAVYTPAG